jgi:hypothetical protein
MACTSSVGGGANYADRSHGETFYFDMRDGHFAAKLLKPACNRKGHDNYAR